MAYDKDDGTHRFIRSLMALPFLSVQEIEAQFDCMHQNCPPGLLEDLVNYVETTWINGTYPLECWSIDGQPIRTNNDLEGYHNALNRRAGGHQNLPFYMLVELLHREAWTQSNPNLSCLPKETQASSAHDISATPRKDHQYVGRLLGFQDNYETASSDLQLP